MTNAGIAAVEFGGVAPLPNVQEYPVMVELFEAADPDDVKLYELVC